MTCNQKSALTTVATAAQTVAANGFLTFSTNNLLTGRSISHAAGSTTASLGYGLYQVSVNADLTPTAAGDIGIQLVRNGAVVPGAEATVTGATGDTYNVGFTTLIAVMRSCCVVNNIANLQVQATAAGTISNASMSIVRLA